MPPAPNANIKAVRLSKRAPHKSWTSTPLASLALIRRAVLKLPAWCLAVDQVERPDEGHFVFLERRGQKSGPSIAQLLQSVRFGYGVKARAEHDSPGTGAPHEHYTYGQKGPASASVGSSGAPTSLIMHRDIIVKKASQSAPTDDMGQRYLVCGKLVSMPTLVSVHKSVNACIWCWTGRVQGFR
jgi:hypothetical protein